VKARALSRPFPVVLNERRGMYHIDQLTSCHCPLCLHCVRVDLVRARVWMQRLWLQAPRTIGRAARNTAKFRSILLEKHKEPKLRFGLRATRIAISVITPDRRYCRPPAVCIFYSCLSPAINYPLVDSGFSVNAGTTVCVWTCLHVC